MTRKKSNVKALALAVTCAILAGGGIGLEPVYAADVTLNLNNGAITAGSVIGTINGTVCGTAIADGTITDGSLTNGKFSGTVTLTGDDIKTAIESVDISKAKVGSDVTSGTIESLVKNVGDNSNAIQAVNGQVTDLDSKVEVYNTNLNTKITEQVSTLDDKIDTKVNASDFSAYQVKNDNAVGTLKYNTQKIEFKKDNMVMTDDATYIEGITHAGDVRLADVVVRAKSIVLEEEFANGTFAQATLTREAIVNLNGMTDGKTKIKVADGSEVGGVTFDQGKVTKVVSINDNLKFESDGIYLNKGDQTKQIKIDNDGKIIIGTSSSAYDTDGFYAGGDDYGAAKAGIKSDGSLKATGFTVDGATGNTTVGGTLSVAGETTFANGIKTDTIVEKTANAGVTVNGNKITTDNKFNDVELKNGNVNATDITANGALKGKTLGIGTNGTEFTVNADGEVQAAGGKVSIDKTGKATFGYTAGNITIIEGQKITTGSIVATDTTVASNISGVQMLDGKITASNMEITGAISLNDLTVNNKLTVGAFSVDKNGVVAGVQSINGANVTASGTGLTIGSATVGAANPFSSTGFTVDANGNVAAQNITAGTYNGNTIGADNKFNGVELKGGDVKATKVTADTITDGTAIMTGGTVTANTITANTSASLAGVTFDASGVDFNGKDIKNVANVTATNVTATTAKLGNLSIAGHVIKNEVDAGGPIGLGTTVTVNNAGELGGITKIDGVNVTDDAGGLAIGTGATQVTIGGANAISVGAGTFTVDSAGLVTGNQFTTTNGSYLKDNELKLNDANIWNTTEGLKAEKAVIGANTLDTAGISTTGTLGVEGVATFGKDAADQTKITQGKAEFTQGGKTTTIKGGEIETDKLTVNDIVLKNSMKDGAGNTITIKGSDGSMSVAGGKFAVDDKGQMTNEYNGTDAAGKTTKTTLKTSVDGINANYTNSVNNNNNLLNINQDGVALGVTDSSNNNLGMLSADANAATMGYGTANSIVVNEDTIKSALGTDVTRVMTNSATEQSIVDKVGAASRSLTANQIVDVAGGMTITTNSNGTTFGNNTANNTLIYGSAITSTNGAATGVLDGSNLTLTNGANKTVLDAGKVTYTGKAGYSNTAGTQTTIDGGIITTDTLKVQRIQLGEKIVDQRTGETIGSGVTLAADGGFTAAGGNFKVTGGTTGSKGSIKNVVGDATNGKTAFETNQQGANMSFEKGDVTSNVSVADGSANVSAGAGSIDVTNESITSKVTDNATSTITKDSIVDKVGNNSVTTDANGTTFANGGSKTTNINGGTITTGKLITDELVITGKGDAAGDGSGSLAFGGNGTIKSDVKEAGSAKNTQFTTDIDGVNTKVTDGTTTTENKVTAAGNSSTVTKDDKHKSEFNQGLTSIGGVVTNGEIKVAQKLDGETGLLTNEVTDANGSSKLEQSGTGLTYTDSAKPDNATRINSSDVSIGSAMDDSKRINLSDLGQIDELDKELTDRDEYKNNSTAVGGINAEAAIRREEVARLDGRINDVNDRVNKVGAMAAAIASLKSIGYDPQAPSEFSIGLGQYKGETGVAMGFFHYPNKNFMINVSLSTAGGETMGGIGATWRFGHKSPQKLLEEQREEQAKKELAAAEKYQAAAKLAKEAQERAEYAAKLARQAQVSADNAKAAADATQAKHFG